MAGRSRSVERRQLTAVFCDLIGSTTLFTQLDPEEVRELLRSYQKCCADQIEAAGGFVAQFQGDGIISYFGYVQASESDAERAIRSALALVDLVPKLALKHSVSLQVRIGIATGLVIVGDPSGEGTRLEQSAFGDTVNLAFRLQTLPQPNQIVVSESTKRLAGSAFSFFNMGKKKLAGFVEPVQAWRLLGPRPVTSQFRVRRDQVLTRIVGRDDELNQLLRTWQRVSAGRGELITIVSEAGIGKSRLIREFRHRIAETRHFWLEGGGTSFSAPRRFIRLRRRSGVCWTPAGAHHRPNSDRDCIARWRSAESLLTQPCRSWLNCSICPWKKGHRQTRLRRRKSVRPCWPPLSIGFGAARGSDPLSLF